MELLIFAKDDWFSILPQKEKNKIKEKSPDFEKQMIKKGDIVEVHEDGWYTGSNRINGFGKDDFIIIVNHGTMKDIELEQPDYDLSVDELGKTSKLKIENVKKYSVDITKLKITADAAGRRIVYENDFSKLKIKNKKDGTELTISPLAERLK